MVTIRRLPDGGPQTGRIRERAADRLSIAPDEAALVGFDAGSLVEVQSTETLYLGEVAHSEPDSLVTVVVEHFFDCAAVAEIEKGWQTAPTDCIRT